MDDRNEDAGEEEDVHEDDSEDFWEGAEGANELQEDDENVKEDDDEEMEDVDEKSLAAARAAHRLEVILAILTSKCNIWCRCK